MGALGSSDRQLQFQQKYKEHQDLYESGLSDIQGHLYGQHYSCPGIVLFFLLKLEPYHKAHRLLQGNKYDLPERLF